MKNYEFVRYPIENRLRNVVQAAEDTLFVATPYIKAYGVDVLISSARTAKSLRVLTNLMPDNVSSDGFDIESLLRLWDRFDVCVTSLGRLHAKAYIADDKLAFLASANLTRGGLLENYEYGMIVRDPPVVKAILADLDAYCRLGSIFARETISDLVSEVAEVKRLRREIEKSTRLSELQWLLRQHEEDLQTAILRNRVEGQQTINRIFSDTIAYLLDTRGPLSTEQLHPLIQAMHPEICDDTIDRVINGQRFGKKWKHLVRNAQQHLKRRGIVVLDRGKWRLVSRSGVAET